MTTTSVRSRDEAIRVLKAQLLIAVRAEVHQRIVQLAFEPVCAVCDSAPATVGACCPKCILAVRQERDEIMAASVWAARRGSK